MTKKKANPRKKSNAKPTDPLRCSHGELLENCPDKRHRRPQPFYTKETGWTAEGIAEQERRRLKDLGRNPHPFADIKAL